VLQPGDLTATAASTEWDEQIRTINAVFDPTATTSTGRPRYLVVPGNHDLLAGNNWYSLWSSRLTGQAELGHSGADGVYFSFSYGNALFVMLDSEHVSDAAVLTAQTQSLATALQGSTALFKFVLFHRPVYPCSTDTSVHAPFAQGLPWIDLAEKHKVDVVFSGHTHVYTRSCPMKGGACTAGAGIVQIETGSTSADYTRSVNAGTVTVSGTDANANPRKDTYDCTTRTLYPAPQGDAAAPYPLNHFCQVQVDGCTARINCYRVVSGNTTPFDTVVVNHCD
jgi:3',5'-cyclic AMP phosphodiesterase CpdA